MNSQSVSQDPEPAPSWVSQEGLSEEQPKPALTPSRRAVHEMNNLLNIITGYCELLTIEAGADPSLQQKISEIEKAAHRAINLTRELAPPPNVSKV